MKTDETARGHGSPYDRGRADAWYSRPPLPHKGCTTAQDTDLTEAEIEEYVKGYNDGRNCGGKDWT